jgi:predicted nucleic acid-binding protein
MFWPRSTSIGDRGRVLVVDASCLVEVLTGTTRAEPIRQRLALDEEHAAPHVIDVEVFSVIRRERRLGRLDQTAADQAVEDLEAWPGERFGHRLLLARAWELRDTVRGWDAMYVALAEALDTVLLTTDARLGAAQGRSCQIEVVV